MSSNKTGNLTNKNKRYVRCHRELNQQNFGYGYNPFYDRTNLLIYINILYNHFLYYQENPGNKCDSYNGDTEPAT